jgi:GNAT superfamily N-acetyltransferase
MTGIEQELRVVLRDGTRCMIRPIRPDDKERLRVGMQRLSRESRYHRFNAHVDRLTPAQLRYFTEIDYSGHMAWVALGEDGDDWPGMGVARYIRLRDEPEVAEAALTVLDDFQGRGLGTVLFGLLVRSAIEAGITTLRNYVQAGNRPMMDMLMELGGEVTDVGSGLLQVDYPLPSTPEDLPDTPAGRVLRPVATARLTLGLVPPLWIDDVSDEGAARPEPSGAEDSPHPDLDHWLDVMLPAGLPEGLPDGQGPSFEEE